jgi:rod shape determining protein RodA
MFKFFRGIDWVLFFSTLFLALLGILMIYSASIEADGIDYSFVIRQTSYLSLGVAAFFIISRIDYRLLAHFSTVFYVAVIALLLLTFIIGETTRGSVRWIDFNFITVQASEIAKPVIILALATFFSKYSPKKLTNVVISFVIVAVPSFLVFLQPDLGNTLIILSLWLVLVFAAGVRFLHLALIIIISSLTAPVAWTFLKDYQKDRLASFLSPQEDPLGSGYNLVQSIIAVGSGGLTGRGFGRGTQSHLNFLPEQKTDFIFATTAEELGFLGVSLVLGSLGIIIYRIYVIFTRCSDSLGSLVVLGVGSVIVIHAFINIGMNIGLFPVTGITLPLLSFGGSSLLSTMIGLGLASSISIHSRKTI